MQEEHQVNSHSGDNKCALLSSQVDSRLPPMREGMYLQTGNQSMLVSCLVLLGPRQTPLTLDKWRLTGNETVLCLSSLRDFKPISQSPSERVLFQLCCFIFIRCLFRLFKACEKKCILYYYFQSDKWCRNILKIKDYTQIKPEVCHFLKALFTQSVRWL